VVKQAGLTLIEVMVAVAILAFSLTALVKMTGQSVNTLSYLEQKNYAQWVALNQINEIDMMKTWPRIGISRGQEKLAGISWYWELNTAKTDSKDLRRLEISVKLDRDDDNAVYQLTAFTHRP